MSVSVTSRQVGAGVVLILTQIFSLVFVVVNLHGKLPTDPWMRIFATAFLCAMLFVAAIGIYAIRKGLQARQPAADR